MFDRFCEKWEKDHSVRFRNIVKRSTISSSSPKKEKRKKEKEKKKEKKARANHCKVFTTLVE